MNYIVTFEKLDEAAFEEAVIKQFQGGSLADSREAVLGCKEGSEYAELSYAEIRLLQSGGFTVVEVKILDDDGCTPSL